MSDRDDLTTQEAGVGDQPAPRSPEPADEAPAPPTAPRIIDKRGAQARDEELQAQESENGLEKIQAQADEYLNDLRRLKAEFENYRKRVLKEQTALVETATAALVERLLVVLDNFELALIAADRTKDYEALVRGVELVFSDFKDVLGKQGLKPIDALGHPFDPELHEAVMQGDGPEDGKPVVTEVFRTGYMLGNRVLRPAMVKVTRQQ